MITLIKQFFNHMLQVSTCIQYHVLHKKHDKKQLLIFHLIHNVASWRCWLTERGIRDGTRCRHNAYLTPMLLHKLHNFLPNILLNAYSNNYRSKTRRKRWKPNWINGKHNIFKHRWCRKIHNDQRRKLRS